MFTEKSIIGIIGCGAMGIGIGQLAATESHQVFIFDSSIDALKKAEINLKNTLKKLIDKGKIDSQKESEIINNINFSNNIESLKPCDLVIEAIIENIEIKKKVFADLEKIVSQTCILASNTSSLSITSIASACINPEKVIGIHFFNPATLMPLVEIIPGIATKPIVTEHCKSLLDSWKKTTVVAKDTPGFIVNRIARPFYSEALRILEEGIADISTIDWAMKEIGGFKMGPFELMDLIGHDVNYTVTETVWTQFYYDPKFKPSISQKRLLEAGFLGRKSGKGFYNYNDNNEQPKPKNDLILGELIFKRILVMLINEAADALYFKIATVEDIDLAMTKGVNYPKGLLKWADDLGIENIVNDLKKLYILYQEDRYRISPILKQMLEQKIYLFHKTI